MLVFCRGDAVHFLLRVDHLLKQERFLEALSLAWSFHKGTARAVVGLFGDPNKRKGVVADKYADRSLKKCPEQGKIQVMEQHFQDLLVQDNGMMDSIEACIVHLDIQQVVQMCWEHHLHDAMIYVYNSGMNDYINPMKTFEEFKNDKQALEYQQRIVDILMKVIVENSDFTPTQVGCLFTFLARQLAKPDNTLCEQEALLPVLMMTPDIQKDRSNNATVRQEMALF
ncbi:Vacuolar protein sorting-associated protein 8-like [Acipenser ruthenus]|uniref:Vacuolar protein sorting-associated protein 8-like n=1 Tax=Acipenser ruthenus TaxID=7906 RepID=A0A444UP73_ACIRT|nr:Vacuolar protein sorting-associated protein 8-like [Acipenser ruthenus]